MEDAINKPSDQDLVEKCIADDRHSQELLYRRYADKMYSTCLIYARDEDDACDILQEGFIRVFRSLHRFRFDCPLEPWIRRIMINVAIEYFRKKRRTEETLETYSNSYESVSESILETIHAGQIIHLVNNLPTKAAMVLKLYAIEGYKHREIAKLMNISVSTSKSQLNRARFLLKALIEKLNG